MWMTLTLPSIDSVDFHLLQSDVSTNMTVETEKVSKPFISFILNEKSATRHTTEHFGTRFKHLG